MDSRIIDTGLDTGAAARHVPSELARGAAELSSAVKIQSHLATFNFAEIPPGELIRNISLLTPALIRAIKDRAPDLYRAIADLDAVRDLMAKGKQT